jgi:uncharacterized protein YbbK (DUF523 family)/uncharacterized protein YbgA (DUF1722 family)
MSEPVESRPILIGISSCLLGERVRFDGAHKCDHYVTKVLARHFQFVPVCPETEVGMAVPRNPVQLEGTPAAPRMIDIHTGVDWTARMNRYAIGRVRSRDLKNLSGFILKARSPSCGRERVQLHGKSGAMTHRGTGLFARVLKDRFPDLPIADESQLADVLRRDDVLGRVFGYDRLQRLFARPFSRNRMLAFHESHEYLLKAHNPEHYRELARLLADIKSFSPAVFKGTYRSRFMKILQYESTTRKNVGVLKQIARHLRRTLPSHENREMDQIIASYGAHKVPLVSPVTLLGDLAEKHDVDEIQEQVYLHPDPRELMLRTEA